MSIGERMTDRWRHLAERKSSSPRMKRACSDQRD